MLYALREVDMWWMAWAAAAGFSDANELGWVESACGVRPEVDLDLASFEGHMSADSALMYCSGALVSFRDACRFHEEVKTELKRVKRITCAHDANATQTGLKRYGPSFSIENGHVRMGVSDRTANLQDGSSWVMRMPAAGEGLAVYDRVMKAHGVATIEEKGLAWARERCHPDLTYTVDWASFRPFIEAFDSDGFKNDEVGTYCSEVLQGVRDACEAGVRVDVVKTVACTFSDVDTPRMSFADGVLTAGFTKRTANVNWNVRAWLEAHPPR